MQATYRAEGGSIAYTPGSAVDAGDVIVLGDDLVTIAKLDIAANELGAVATSGVYDVVKDESVVTVGDSLYWDTDGDPVDGTAGSGAFSIDPTVGPYAGEAIAAAATDAGTVRMRLMSSPMVSRQRSAVVAVAATGSTQADAAALAEDALNTVSGADGTKGVLLPVAAAGKRCRAYNEHATNGLKVYPATGDDINDGTTNAAVTIEGKTRAEFECIDGTTWAAQYTANT